MARVLGRWLFGVWALGLFLLGVFAFADGLNVAGAVSTLIVILIASLMHWRYVVVQSIPIGTPKKKGTSTLPGLALKGVALITALAAFPAMLLAAHLVPGEAFLEFPQVFVAIPPGVGLCTFAFASVLFAYGRKVSAAPVAKAAE